MEFLFDWVKNIEFYLIFITLILNVLPHNSSKKYIRLFTGMILVLIVISPVTKFFDMEDKLAGYFQYFDYIFDSETGAVDYGQVDQKSGEAVAGEYKAQIIAKIEAIANSHSLTVENVQIAMADNISDPDYGTIQSVTVALTQQNKEGDIIIPPIIIGGGGSNEVSSDLTSEMADTIRDEITASYPISKDSIIVQIRSG